MTRKNHGITRKNLRAIQISFTKEEYEEYGKAFVKHCEKQLALEEPLELFGELVLIATLMGLRDLDGKGSYDVRMQFGDRCLEGFNG